MWRFKLGDPYLLPVGRLAFDWKTFLQWCCFVTGRYVHSWRLWRPHSSARCGEFRSSERGGVSTGWRCFGARAGPIRTHSTRRRRSIQPPWRHQATREGRGAPHDAPRQNRDDVVQVRFLPCLLSGGPDKISTTGTNKLIKKIWIGLVSISFEKRASYLKGKK